MRRKLNIYRIICFILIAVNFIGSIKYITKVHELKTIIKDMRQPMVIEIVNDVQEPAKEEPVIEETPAVEPDPEPEVIVEEPAPVETYSSLATMIAKVVWGEARGLGQTEQSCVVWTILNRADAWDKSVESIITAPNQFYYDPGFPTTDDHGRDIKVLVQEILNAWESGDDSIRTLPEGYFFYVGDGSHNYFYADYNNPVYWDYSYGSPYSD